jgi:outer membrane protein assembly factor BamB
MNSSLKSFSVALALAIGLALMFTQALGVYSTELSDSQPLMETAESTQILGWAMFQHDLRRTGFLGASSSSFAPKIGILWRYAIDSIDCSPTVSDLNGDGKVEIVIGAKAGVYCFSGNGSLVWFYPTGSSDNFPTIANFNKTGQQEVLVSSNDGVIRCLSGTTGELVWASQCSGSGNWNAYPTIADLNGDGQPEIIAISGDVDIFNSNGSKIWGKRINVGTLPAVADINGDGELEIVLNTFGQVCVLSHDGEQLLYHEFESGGGPMGVPTIADITGDGSLEIILANHLGIFVFNSTGDILWEKRGYELRASSPAVADINGDGQLEIVAVSLDDGVVYSFDKDGNVLWSNNERKVGTFSSPAIADINGNGELEIVLGPDEGWLSCFDSEGKTLWNIYIGEDPLVETCDFSRGPAICDVNADGVLDITVGSKNYLYVFTGLNQTSDTTPPEITIISPTEMTYLRNATGVFFGLIFFVNEPVSFMSYSLDGQANVAITGNTTMTELSDGNHSIVVYASDMAGNTGSSEAVHFAIDTTPPTISILSLENETYTATSIPLDIAINEQVSWMGYTLDTYANVTIMGNTTITGVSDGSHNLAVYANDTIGNTGISETVHFYVTQKTNPQPETNNPPTTTYIIVAATATTVAAAIAAVVLKKRSK